MASRALAKSSRTFEVGRQRLTEELTEFPHEHEKRMLLSFALNVTGVLENDVVCEWGKQELRK